MENHIGIFGIAFFNAVGFEANHRYGHRGDTHTIAVWIFYVCDANIQGTVYLMVKNMDVRLFNTPSERRKALANYLSVDLTHTGSVYADTERASLRNCENMIGITQIPLGIAGPLIINHKPSTINEYYIPLATTEAALVASISRGCKVIAESGGASVMAYRIGATRGPVFKVHDMDHRNQLYEFILSHREDLNEISQSTSGHLKLTDVQANGVGLYFFVRFTFDTQDAMGLNMVTIASDEIVRFIEEKTQAHCISLSGNYCVDKKPSWANFTNGRGFEAWAEVRIPNQVIHQLLKTTPSDFYQTWLSKCMIGSALSGSMGFNAQYANVLAAMFIACGQDPAHVAECSIGITTAEVQADSVYVSVFLPDIMLGTVGGGTGLATQKEALSMLGVCGGDNGNNSQKFAEIVVASVLAGEISLLASLAQGTLAKAHQKLGRGAL